MARTQSPCRHTPGSRRSRPRAAGCRRGRSRTSPASTASAGDHQLADRRRSETSSPSSSYGVRRARPAPRTTSPPATPAPSGRCRGTPCTRRCRRTSSRSARARRRRRRSSGTAPGDSGEPVEPIARSADRSWSAPGPQARLQARLQERRRRAEQVTRCRSASRHSASEVGVAGAAVVQHDRRADQQAADQEVPHHPAGGGEPEEAVAGAEVVAAAPAPSGARATIPPCPCTMPFGSPVVPEE